MEDYDGGIYLFLQAYISLSHLIQPVGREISPLL